MAFEEGSMMMLMEDSQLRKLSKILLNQEAALMDAFDSEIDRAKYIEECNDAYDKVTALLNKCSDLNLVPNVTHDHLKHVIDTIMEHVRSWCLLKGWVGLVQELSYEMKDAYEKFVSLRKKYNGIIRNTEQPSGTSKAEIVNDIHHYVKFAINVSLQFIQDCCSRKRWISKIEAHFDILVKELELPSVQNETSLKRMAENVSLYKRCMLEYASVYGSDSGPVNSEAYSTLLKKEQIQFSKTAKRKMNELGFAGEFYNLTMYQQIKVISTIINEPGGACMPSIDFVGTELGSGPISTASHCLLVESIFGQGGFARLDSDSSEPSFHLGPMPDGMALACEIAYGNY
ncbi:hypothetical protein vseg_008919 [Gypsophila vaccaria]